MKRVALSFVLLCLPTAAAFAQQSRVFVSAANGNDVNACTIAAPCRTLAKAVTAVLNGGEVLALDSGGYGPVTITQSVSIVSPLGVEGSITQTNSAQTAVTVNAPGATVILRGLSLFGLGVAGYGVSASDVSSLIIDSCNFNGFVAQGILLSLASSSATMSVDNSTFYQNGTGIETIALSTNLATFSVAHCRFGSNFTGLKSYEGSVGTIYESTFVNSAYGIEVTNDASNQTAYVLIDNCVVSGNQLGLASQVAGTGSVVTIAVARSVIANNSSYGLIWNGSAAHISSRGDNTLLNNSPNGTFTDSFLMK